HAFNNIPMTESRPCDVFNLSTATCTSVSQIAAIVAEEMGLSGAQISYTGGQRGWPGDAPVILMDANKMRQHGWVVQHTSDEAVRIAAREIVAASAPTNPPVEPG